MNHRRGHSRRQVRCRLCTSGRDHIGSDRQQGKRDGFASEAVRVSNGQFYDFCPDCDGTGKCNCGCNGVCVPCGGTKVTFFHTMGPSAGQKKP